MTKVWKKARSLSEEAVEIVVYKMGGDGAITFSGGKEIRTGIYPVDALKPTGAGDSFMAGPYDFHRSRARFESCNLAWLCLRLDYCVQSGLRPCHAG